MNAKTATPDLEPPVPTAIPPPHSAVIAAFAIIYLVWGSTYLGIRFAVETLPPFLMGGARFLIAGTILYLWLRFRGVPAPEPKHWRNAAIVGALLLGVGNGGVNWAETRVPSGIAALLIAGTPLWFALLDWLRPHGVRPAWQTIIGILIGFAGVTLLVTSRTSMSAEAIDPAGAAAVIFAGFCWACGSLYARYTPKPEMPLMGVASQMIAGGAILLALGFLFGETRNFHWANVSERSWWAFAYLTMVGSLLGFSAYSWLLKNVSPARISTYAYVNPVIAVFLGWALAGEKLTGKMLGASAVILVGVIIITGKSSTARK